MLITEQGKLKKESISETRGKMSSLKEGENQTLSYCIYH